MPRLLLIPRRTELATLVEESPILKKDLRVTSLIDVIFVIKEYI